MTITPTIARPLASLPVLLAKGRAEIAIRAGTVVYSGETVRPFTEETRLSLPDLAPGTDYAVTIGEDGAPVGPTAATCWQA